LAIAPGATGHRRKAMRRRRGWLDSVDYNSKINSGALPSKGATIHSQNCTCGTLRPTSVLKERAIWRTTSRACSRRQLTTARKSSWQREERYSKRVSQVPILSPASLVMARGLRASGKFPAWGGWRIRTCREDCNNGTTDMTTTQATRCLTLHAGCPITRSRRWRHISAL
jgi:hypothetical protein